MTIDEHNFEHQAIAHRVYRNGLTKLHGPERAAELLDDLHTLVADHGAGPLCDWLAQDELEQFGSVDADAWSADERVNLRTLYATLRGAVRFIERAQGPLVIVLA
jgi:hypothetical protein